VPEIKCLINRPPSKRPTGPLFNTIMLSFIKYSVELIVVVEPRTLKLPWTVKSPPIKVFF
jgi:hypothetical protein